MLSLLFFDFAASQVRSDFDFWVQELTVSHLVFDLFSDGSCCCRRVAWSGQSCFDSGPSPSFWTVSCGLLFVGTRPLFFHSQVSRYRRAGRRVLDGPSLCGYQRKKTLWQIAHFCANFEGLNYFWDLFDFGPSTATSQSVGGAVPDPSICFSFCWCDPLSCCSSVFVWSWIWSLEGPSSAETCPLTARCSVNDLLHGKDCSGCACEYRLDSRYCLFPFVQFWGVFAELICCCWHRTY